MRFMVTLGAALLVTYFQTTQPSPTSPDPKMPRPIKARDTVFMEEMTWLEIRDAMADGKKTVIVATGGVEMNGPYLATGKHQYVLRATSEAIARRLGDALVAPLVPFVPEGDIDPPTSHMRYPGTISLTEETYEKLLKEICCCLHTHGFERIMLIGDSGGNQQGQKQVADELNKRWSDRSTRVYHLAEYYDYTGVDEWVHEQGIHEVPEGHHDSFAITATIMTVDPHAVRMDERVAADKFRINGIDLNPVERTLEFGRRIIDLRVAKTIEAFKVAMEKDAAP